jgi:tetratricopeptide (TPR) repeat protein/O-antigen ligase
MGRRGRTASAGPDVLWSRQMDEPQESKLRLLGVGVLCAKISLVPIVFHQSFDWPFTIPKVLLSHALAYILAGILAGLVLRFGWNFVVRSWLHVPVLAFLVVNATATVFAADLQLALYGVHARMLGLGTAADLVVLYFAVVMLVRKRLEVIALVACGLGASLLVLAYEVVQLTGNDPLRWSSSSASAIRPFSTIGQATSLAQYLTTLAVGTFALALTIQRFPRPVRVLLVAYSGILLAGAGATGTRSAAIGLAMGSLSLVALIWLIHPSRRARALSVMAAGAAAAALVALLVLSPLGARLFATFDRPAEDDTAEDPLLRFEASADTRAALYAIALAEVTERPILGYGPDNFSVGVPKYRSANAPYEVRQSLATSPHGWLTQVATNSGIVGLVAFLAIPITAFVMTLRAGYRPIAIAGCGMIAAWLGTGLTTINDIATDWLLWVAAAMIAVATAQKEKANTPKDVPVKPVRSSKRKRGADSNPRLRTISAVSLAVFGVALAVTTLNPLEASRLANAAQQSRAPGRESVAIELASRAVRIDPGRAEYWHGLGLANIAGSRIGAASAAFERAMQLAPHDVRHIGDLARAMLLLDNSGQTGARARAIELAERAVQVDPNNPLANLTRAIVMQGTGNLAEARRSVERALALDPQSSNASLYATAIQIYLSSTQASLASGDLAGALAFAERALTVHPRPTDVRLYVTATQVYLAAGRPTDAVRTARLGLEVVSPPPTTVGLRVELARALVAIGESGAALAELDAALAIQPNDPAAQRLRAEIQAGLSRQ